MTERHLDLEGVPWFGDLLALTDLIVYPPDDAGVRQAEEDGVG